jgi:hypothetical protein
VLKAEITNRVKRELRYATHPDEMKIRFHRVGGLQTRASEILKIETFESKAKKASFTSTYSVKSLHYTF